MRHRKSYSKFGRSPSHRRALMRNLATSLLAHEKVETTLAKAKDLRRVTERLITLAGSDTLHARRRAYNYLYSKPVVHKLFAEIGPKYKERPGGYTRIIKLGQRSSDAAELAVIELVQEDYSPKAKKKSKARSKAKSKTKAKQAKEEKAEAKEETPEVVEEEKKATESQEESAKTTDDAAEQENESQEKKEEKS